MVKSPASVTASAGIISEKDFALAGFFAAAAGSLEGSSCAWICMNNKQSPSVMINLCISRLVSNQ